MYACMYVCMYGCMCVTQIALELSEDSLVWFPLFTTREVPCKLYNNEVCMCVYVYVCDSTGSLD